VQVEERSDRVAVLEQELKKERVKHQQLVESESSRRLLIITSVLDLRTKRYTWKKWKAWIAFIRQRYVSLHDFHYVCRHLLPSAISSMAEI
jgi:hypothetical protein